MDYEYGFTSRKKRASDYRAIAWNSLKGHYWLAFLAGLVASVLGVTGTSVASSFSLNFRFGGSSSASSDAGVSVETLEMGPEVWIALGVIAMIVLVILLLALAFSIFVTAPATTGYACFNLGIADGNPSFASLFRPFKTSYKQSVGLYIRYNLRLILCALPTILAIGAYAVMVGMICITMSLEFNDLIHPENFLDLGWIMTVLIAGLGVVFLAEIVSAVLIVIARYKYSMCFTVLADTPSLSSREALRQSARLMKGNKWRLFCLRLSFIGWMLLAMLTCGVGMIFLIPYAQAAEAVFYRDITGTASGDTVLNSIGYGHYTFENGTFSS